MTVIHEISDHGAQFKFEPPLAIPNGVVATGLAEAVAWHIAGRESRVKYVDVITEQVSSVSRAADDNQRRAQMLSRMVGDNQNITVN